MQNSKSNCTRYQRHPLTVLPISSDSEEDPDVQTQNVAFHSESKTGSTCTEDVLTEEFILDQQESSCFQISSQNSVFGEGFQILSSQWNYVGDSDLPEKCEELLVQYKKEAFQQLVREVIGIRGGKVVLVCGNKKTGKKTLVSRVLSKFKPQFTQCYIDLKRSNLISRQKFNEFLSLMTKEVHNQKKNNIFVVNSLRGFMYMLRKTQNIHHFRRILHRMKHILVFIDKPNEQLEKRVQTEIKATTIQVPNNSLAFLSSSLISLINLYPWQGTKWTISQPLSKYFVQKLPKENCSLSTLQDLRSFLQTLSDGQQLQKKVSHDILFSFCERINKVELSLGLSHLNIHQKLVLAALYLKISKQELLTANLSDIYEVYTWSCSSLSLQPRSKKELIQQVYFQLQTYKMIKLLGGGNRNRQQNVLLKMELSILHDCLLKQPCLSKLLQR